MKKIEGVNSIIINKKGEVLLNKKTFDYPSFPGGYWALFGGKIEKEEKPLEAIIREIKEELGITLSFKFLKKINFNIKELEIIDYIFYAEFNEEILNIHLNEGGGFGFFNLSELKSIMIIPAHLKILKEFIGKSDQI